MMTKEPQSIAVLANMFFSSKLKGSIEQAGYAYRGAIGETGLLKLVDDCTPVAVVLDLGKDDIDFASLTESLRNRRTTTSFPIIAFCGHLETAKLSVATEWGCDVVTSNGAIIASFNLILEEALGRRNEQQQTVD